MNLFLGQLFKHFSSDSVKIKGIKYNEFALEVTIMQQTIRLIANLTRESYLRDDGYVYRFCNQVHVYLENTSSNFEQNWTFIVRV